ncbi:hypothetical protein HDV00_012755 [Rhizophlyctis rosea]|nr:hypothetical protein HDV00_012755 [Rhizophlyctis rosea]
MSNPESNPVRQSTTDSDTGFLNPSHPSSFPAYFPHGSSTASQGYSYAGGAGYATSDAENRSGAFSVADLMGAGTGEKGDEAGRSEEVRKAGGVDAPQGEKSGVRGDVGWLGGVEKE